MENEIRNAMLALVSAVNQMVEVLNSVNQKLADQDAHIEFLEDQLLNQVEDT